MQIMANFTSSMKEFLDARQKWASVEALRANTDTLMPIGFTAYCEAEAQWYILDSATDPKNPATYVWAKYIPSVELSDEVTKAMLGVTSFDEAIKTIAAEDYITIEKMAADEQSPYAAVYRLKRKNASEELGYEYLGEAINIPKDMFVQSAELKTVETENTPVEGFKVGERYIDMLIANTDNTHVYINVNDLVDDNATGISYVYTEGEGDPITTTVADMLDVLRLFKNDATPRIANLTETGTISTDYVAYSEDETATQAISGLKTHALSLESMVNALAAGESIKPEFAVTPSNTTYLNAVSTTIENLSFTVSGTNLNLIEGEITVDLYSGSDKIATQTMTKEMPSVVIEATDPVTSNTTFKVVCSYKFAGDVSPRTVEKKTTYTFVNYSYYGIIDDGADVVSGIDTLTKVLKTSVGLTYTGITCKNKKVVYVFPETMGSISSIKDANNFDVTDVFETSTVIVNSVSCTQLISKDTMTLTNGKLIFA